MEAEKFTFGAEREWFITKEGKIVPEIGRLLPALQVKLMELEMSENTFTFELFAGQVEDRTRVCESIADLFSDMRENERILRSCAKDCGFSVVCREYVTEAELGVLEVNPFNVRHKNIWNELSHEMRVSASQVAAIHIHVGASEEMSVTAINRATPKVIDRFCRLGDNSGGERLRAYRRVAGSANELPRVSSMNELLSYIESKGGEKNVWDLIRYKPSTKTVEFRMLGATADYERIRRFVEACRCFMLGRDID